MDKKEAIELARQYKSLLETRLPVSAVYLYGSYSKGTFTEESDIDIAVVMKKVDKDFFNDTPLLWKLRRKVSSLIEPVMFAEDDQNPLYSDILNTGIAI